MSSTAQCVAAELVDVVVRARLWVPSARAKAEDSTTTGELIPPALADMEERLRAVHLVALVGGGWCASDRCGAQADRVRRVSENREAEVKSPTGEPMIHQDAVLRHSYYPPDGFESCEQWFEETVPSALRG